jgi:hypothetical protein
LPKRPAIAGKNIINPKRKLINAAKTVLHERILRNPEFNATQSGWQKTRFVPYTLVKIVGLNAPNGKGDVLTVAHGILWSKKLKLLRVLEVGSPAIQVLGLRPLKLWPWTKVQNS